MVKNFKTSVLRHKVLEEIDALKDRSARSALLQQVEKIRSVFADVDGFVISDCPIRGNADCSNVFEHHDRRFHNCFIDWAQCAILNPFFDHVRCSYVNEELDRDTAVCKVYFYV